MAGGTTTPTTCSTNDWAHRRLRHGRRLRFCPGSPRPVCPVDGLGSLSAGWAQQDVQSRMWERTAWQLS